jgi:hypothetical protein
MLAEHLGDVWILDYPSDRKNKMILSDMSHLSHNTDKAKE